MEKGTRNVMDWPVNEAPSAPPAASGQNGEGRPEREPSFFTRLGDVLFFFVISVGWGFRPPYPVREWVRVTSRLAWRCFLPVLLVVGPMGAASALQGMEMLRIFGATSLLSPMLAVVLMREISPVMASMMVASQAGSSIAAELGAMRVKEEIDAYEVISVNPIQHLVFPRLLAGLLVTPLLNAIAILAGLYCGYIVAVVIKGQDAGVFIGNLGWLVTEWDLWAGIIKTAVFGLTITTVACYYGYHSARNEESVGIAANRTVVSSVLVVLLLNYLLSHLLYSNWME